MSASMLLGALPLNEQACALHVLLCLVAQRNLILCVKPEEVQAASKLASSLLVGTFGLACQRIRIRSTIAQRDFTRALFPAPPISRVRSRSARKRSLPPTPSSPEQRRPPPPGPKRQPSESAGFPFAVAPHGQQEDDDDSTSTAHPGSPRAHGLRPDWERGLSTHYDGPPASSPTSHSTSLASGSSSQLLEHWSPRLPNALVLSGLEHAGTATQHALSEILRTRTVVLEDEAGSPTRPQLGHGGGGGTTWVLPDPFIVVYVCPADSRERPPIGRGLLDRFGFSTSFPLNGPTSPYRSPGARKVAISKEDLQELRQQAADVYTHHTLTLQMSALLSATRHHPRLDGTLLTRQSTQDFAALVRASRVVMGGPASAFDAGETVGERDASENDALRVYPHVVAHRVRVRDGPRDEVLSSAVFGALAGNGSPDPFPDDAALGGRPSVREIIKEVINAV